MKESICNLLNLDNAATSWPKPPEVARAMSHYLAEVGANPGRSGHRLSILKNIPGVTIYGMGDAQRQTATIALNLEGMEPSTLGQRLDEEYGILCRVGLHCAPAAHRTLGTFPNGCARLSLGAFHAETDLYKISIAIRSFNKEINGNKIRGSACRFNQPRHAH